MFPVDKTHYQSEEGLPRIRGGVSIPVSSAVENVQSSPHTRGCFPQGQSDVHRLQVFPAYAGVFPYPGDAGSGYTGLPHIRGGVSRFDDDFKVDAESSPHTRGCFRWRKHSISLRTVFPAYAGVFPLEKAQHFIEDGLPRIRGGVSMPGTAHLVGLRSSPHTRGCFQSAYGCTCPDSVFPAYAGVFPGL